MLEEGGNAVDACVAGAFAAWVAESPLTGPGAGGFALVAPADGSAPQGVAALRSLPPPPPHPRRRAPAPAGLLSSALLPGGRRGLPTSSSPPPASACPSGREPRCTRSTSASAA